MLLRNTMIKLYVPGNMWRNHWSRERFKYFSMLAAKGGIICELKEALS